jgi:altronate hydrolase
MPALLQIHPSDSVAVALRALAAGESWRGVTVTQPVPRGHKLALQALRAGGTVRKYGQPIGLALSDIAPGEWVHSHNLATALRGELDYRNRGPALAAASAVSPHTWQGYRRADGRAATRNEVWILPTVGCVGQTAEAIALAARQRHAGRIDGIHAFTHPHGCSQLGDDLAGTRRLLAGLATHPNAAGVLLLGLGCESNQLERLLQEVPEHARGRLRCLVSQSVGDEHAAAAALIDELVEQAATAQRVPLPLGELTLGLKCGGSDAFSGLTANPLLGRLSDHLAAAGGKVILTEIPEIFGAEQALLERATSDAVFEAGAGLVNRFKRHYLDQGLPVSENPSPGNLAGGITTLEEKSLGAVQKAGLVPLADVIGYGAQASQPGLSLLEAPGNDAVSSTALVAAGATLLVFTTGRGTPLGFPAPTIKVASNATLAETKPHWIDFDASLALHAGLQAADEAFLARVLALASGEPCAAERNGQRSIAIWKRGATL